MQYVKNEITAFLDTNLTDVYNDWNPATTYSFESGTPTNTGTVRYNSFYYRSLIDSNTNQNPETYDGIKWLKWAVSNKYAMLDLRAQTRSYYTGNMYATFAKSKTVDTIGVGYYDAETILVEVLDDIDAVLWSYETPSSIYDGIDSWWTWTYPSYTYAFDRSIMIKVPPSLGTKIKVTFNKSGDSTQTSCGFLVAGESVDMGCSLQTVNFRFNSYAVKEFDSFGTLTITKRAVQDTVDFETIIDRNSIMSAKRKIKSIYNDIIMFIVDEREDSEFENLITLGVIENAEPILTEFDKTTITWSVIEAI